MNILEFYYVLDEMVSLVCFVTASARFTQLWRARTAQAARCKISKWPFLRLFFIFLDPTPPLLLIFSFKWLPVSHKMTNDTTF
jgi:hypothetical protein